MNQVARPDVRAFLDILNQSPLAALESLGPEAARTLTAQVRAQRPPIAHDLSVVVDLDCPGPGGSIPLRLYDLRAARPAGPVIVYLHGGGFVLGDLESHHQICIEIATQVDLPVVSIGYRLAPEHPWPAAPDDAEAATRWLAEYGLQVFGAEATSLVLAGDSAGANLAAVTARALADRPAVCPVLAQFLIYPCVSLDPESRSMRENAEGMFLTKKALDWFNAQYQAPADSPRYNLLAFDQGGMPPTLLVTAELDPLRDEGRSYAARLIEAGTPVVYQEIRGHIHGCFGFASAIPSTKPDIDKAMVALRTLLS